MVYIGLPSDKISKVHFQNLKFEEVYIYVYLTFVIYLCNIDFSSILWSPIYNFRLLIKCESVRIWLIMPQHKTSVCVKLMYTLFFFPNEQGKHQLCSNLHKLCTSITAFNLASSPFQIKPLHCTISECISGKKKIINCCPRNNSRVY